jgi:hypothetical protein
MSVNGVTGSKGAADLYGTYTTSAKNAEKTENKKEENTNNSGVVYEPSSKPAATTQTSKKPDANLVAKLKADSDARVSQLKSLVEQMISKQGQTIGKADSIWRFLAEGNFTVDAATKAQAQKDIADDGYWGVEQTSSRIVDFATALAGSDPEKLEKMRDAFKKGFDDATSTWGKSLPDISQRTYQAVMDKFDALMGTEE